ncbi:MAG: hypothetical protein U0R68_14360 [Candidatus Nanopelagicales bacterium]
MTSSATSTTLTTAPAPTARDDVPQVEHSTRPALAVGAAVILGAVALAVAGTLVSRSTTPDTTPDTVPAVAVAGPVAAYVVGDASHGGPGSRADAVTALRCSPAVSATVAGELSHGGPGSRSDLVRPSAPTTTVEPVADVAHGTAGSVVVTTAARA